MLRSAVLHAALAVTLAASAPLAALADKPVVTVFAAASLREAFEAAAPAFTKETGYPVRFEFGGSDTLATQMLQGAPVDVFASANAPQMDRVAAGIETPQTLARNHLVVIVPKDDRAVTGLTDLAKHGVKLVLAATTVPVGAYARDAFANLAKERGYPADFAARATANVVSEETDVKAVAAKIALGEADAGVVYATDVTPQLAPKLRVLHFPDATAPEAQYPIAVAKNAPNADGAHAFVAFITSPPGFAYLRARGFEQ